MSGQKISFLDRISSMLYIFHAYRTGLFGDAKGEISFHKQLLEIFRANVNIDINKARILDLGCGQTAVQTILFKADGADVTGIDMEVPTYKMGIKTFMRVIRANGIERAVKSLARHLLFDRRFFSELFSGYGKSIPLNELDIRIMNATDLSFPDNHFDFIYSAWTFEHIEDVPGAIREINRVLKPSGIAWIGIHLFPSLSGGHHLDWAEPDKSLSDKVSPWDHLLDNKYPVNTYLNRYRLGDYREFFSRHMKLLNEKRTYEGESLLTAELEKMLQHKDYTREDLITRIVVFLCKKNNV